MHPTTNGVAAVRIELPLTSLPQVLAGGPRAAMRSVKLDGDAEFAQVVLEVAQNLKWEFEEDLSKWIGDILAHRVTASARHLADGAQRAHRNVAQSVAEYLIDEQEELVRTRDVETLGVAVRTVPLHRLVMHTYPPIAKGSTFREPHFEHLHRRRSSETVVHGLYWAMSSSIGQVCLWPQPSQRTPMVAILR